MALGRGSGRKVSTYGGRLVVNAALAGLSATVFYTGGLPNADWSISILLAWRVVLTGSAFGCAALMSFIRMPRLLTRAGSVIFVVAGVAFGTLVVSMLAFCVHLILPALMPQSISWRYAVGGALTGLFVVWLFGFDRHPSMTRFHFHWRGGEP
jgi:hypothetical protein